MGNYDDAMEIMNERFGRDTLIAVATTDGTNMHNRMVDAYYMGGAFYISTSEQSSKARQTADHPNVAICSPDWFTGHGTAENLGWVLEPENAEMRAKIREAFAAWYEFANDESSRDSIILKISLTDGLLIKDHNEVRYMIDFTKQTALKSENLGEFA